MKNYCYLHVTVFYIGHICYGKAKTVQKVAYDVAALTGTSGVR